MVTLWQRLAIVLLLLVCLALGVVTAIQGVHSEPVVLVAGKRLPAVQSVPELSLETHKGDLLSHSIWVGRWSLVFFGFGSCPDYCPLELQKLAGLMRRAGDPEQLQILFVTVDPERDTRDKLAAYVGFFHPHILGVRGPNSELARLASFFGASYERSVIIDKRLLSVPAGIDMPENAGPAYQVNHSNQLFMVNPRGEFVAYFSPPYEPDLLWQDIQNLMAHAR